ncbi:MAG TPA: hypothetical protein DCQ06_06575 [Myxococcales bacterium]|nr:hypothetical protein [Myxococcales bacterium]
MDGLIRFLVVALCVSMLLLASCDKRDSAPSRPASQAQLWHPCRISHVSEPLSCAEVAVRERPSETDSPTIKITVVRFAAHATQPKPDPLIFLAGGPGQAASAVAHQVLVALRALRDERDLLFIDLRGTGRSGALHCDLGRGDEAFVSMLSPTLSKEALATCAASVSADLSAYHTTNVIADLETVAEALGLDQVNVIGVSYGTRVALRWQASHPGRIRSMVLDGVAPPQQPLFASFAVDAQRAWDLLVDDCAASPSCKRRYLAPNRLLERTLQAAQLAQEVTVTSPLSGEPVRIELSRAGVAMAIRAILYSPEFSAGMLFALEQSAQGDWLPLLSLASTLTAGVSESMAIGALLSTCCSEDYQLFGQKSAESEAGFVGRAALHLLSSACLSWPHNASLPGFSKAARGSTPTLMFSGELDPVTPPRWAELAAKSLSAAQHKVFSAVGHGTLSTPCARRWLRDFVRDPAAKLQACAHTRTRPPFWLHRQAPPP